MAKKRYINTKFWSDSYISELTTQERYLFLYFLTNEHTDICGIYEVTLRTISFETGIDYDSLSQAMKHFSKDKKIYYVDGWVCIKNFSKHQAVNESIRLGIERSLLEIPKQIMQKITDCDSLGTPSGILNLTKPNLDLTKPNSTPEAKEPREETKLQQVINYFYELKGWNWKDQKYKKIYSRFTKSAKDLLELTEQDVKEAQRKLKILADWANSRKLDWSIETVFKKWFDLPQLQPREKKPKWEGQPLFKDTAGRWKIVMHTGEVKIFNAPESEIVYE